MTELKEVFGSLNVPQELASSFFNSEKRKSIEQKLASAGNAFSLDAIESDMNALTRSLLSLGASHGDNIAIYGIDYSDALNLYLAAGQVGVNVVNLSSSNNIVEFHEEVARSKSRFVFFAESAHSEFGEGYLDDLFITATNGFPECAIVKGKKNNNQGVVITWNEFQKLERFATNWEVGLLRVV
ncbi:hypothetical protein N9545_04425 [Salibacteraceae bacterium]|nr:hypothetical protein [Salibacteraceae bacterium]